ncbi:hypothetical protein P7K49_020768, partial [Saguinus oedipus]
GAQAAEASASVSAWAAALPAPPTAVTHLEPPRERERGARRCAEAGAERRRLSSSRGGGGPQPSPALPP